MPQINRIRVNNVKYNFGTQYYDDFMMRFSGKNTIYDLANGGGKSLLMLLLLQNMIPNCTLDDKQPIEKLFRGNTQNTAIHSLIEWNLEECYRKDNYKYMVTGFCARKAKDGSTESENDEVKAISTRDTASIEYFNYVIFYREFGDNDIKNLPLSKGDKRVTYQELKDYLRELEKKDFKVSVKIFDRKGDYISFISQYGIYESEWEIIRGINKTEGHVRTYFESNYRTSRKVVEDLLIEEIIQKSFNNKLGVVDDDDRMAKTLLDIKDKLVELAHKHGTINQYDAQMGAITEFADQIGDFEDIYKNKEKKQAELVLMLAKARQQEKVSQRESEKLEANLERMEVELKSEEKMVDTAEILEQQRAMDEVHALMEDSLKQKNKLLAESKGLRDTVVLRECLADYAEYKEYKRQLDEINQIMDNRLRGHEDITLEMKQLAKLRKERDEKWRGDIEKKRKEIVSFMEHEERNLKQLLLTRKTKEKEIAQIEGKIKLLEVQIKQKEEHLANAMKLGGILVPESAKEELENILQTLLEQKNELEKYESEYVVCKEKYNLYMGNRVQLENSIAWEDEKIKKLKIKLSENNENQGNVDDLKRVYGKDNAKDLVRTIGDILQKTSLKISQCEESIRKLQEYADNIKKGVYKCNGEDFKRIGDYLVEQYGDDVISGSEWFNTLNPGQKRDILKRVPFVHYGYVIKNDFERIKEDIRLQEFDGSSYAIPIISENVLYDMKLEVNTELVAFSARNLSFLTDMGRLETENKQCVEEIQSKQAELEHLLDRKNVVMQDYETAFAKLLMEQDSKENPEQLLKDLVVKVEGLKDELNDCALVIDACEEKDSKLKAEIASLKEEINKNQTRKDLISRVIDVNTQLLECITLRESNEKMEEVSQKELEEANFSIEPLENKVNTYKEQLLTIDAQLERNKVSWSLFDAYYDENAKAASLEMSDDDIESRFMALKTIIEEDTKDITDKERLKAHYFASMEKCKNSIEYRGLSFDDVKDRANEATLLTFGASERIELKEKLGSFDKQIDSLEEKLDSQSALYNRLDGSIAHGIHQIEERYGEFEAFACDNPTSFIKQHKALMEKINENKKKLRERQKLMQKEQSNLQVMIKDMERIIRNSGMDEAQPLDGENLDAIDFEAYEQTQQDLERILRQENRRKDTFAKQRSELVGKLKKFNAQELAEEFEVNLLPPKDVEACRQLREQLLETNSYIELEKERIAKSIEDMERIKDSFENRCIQTCSNIKTELDRLPQLSTITMDDEVIKIIGLQIPYVKEEQYKERMSDYIDETVAGAESFSDERERLLFIRNRLAWKRLFSVIVTDMNAIRVNLYKRERIKDQSRYLKYEEAVGSTGQSQGIYIQFLIAIINYISNINASAKEAATLGKTIFIDNPFGAAKDIYIWEPIFKLLATNHVQLIVPARGATPAITGRFDVNYILGQKLVDSRQQTVVVDYMSRVEMDELEYAKIDYEQQSLDLL